MAIFEDYVDDILASSNPKRKFRQINNPDGTISFEDVSQYKQKGTMLGAKRMNELAGAVNELRNLLHPIGSIYMSLESTSPETLFGGKWEQIKGRFLLATGLNDANTNNEFGNLAGNILNRKAGEMGGEIWHTLTTQEMPVHDGHIKKYSGTAGKFLNSNTLQTDGKAGRGWEVYNSNEALPAQNPMGGGQKHNNMPPYLSVYMWKRVS